MTDKANHILGRVKKNLDKLGQVNDSQDEILDKLIARAELIDYNNQQNKMNFIRITSKIPELNITNYEEIDSMNLSDNGSWELFLSKTTDYAHMHNINLEEDPFEKLLSKSERIELTKRIQADYQMSSPKCDKYDYTIAAFSGVVTGLIDSFFVGMPEESKLGKWTEEKIDNVVVKFANTVWHADKKNDARFGTTMAIPVVLNELIIRLMWSVKSKIYHNNNLKDSMPIGNKPELRRILVVGHGVLCLVDGTDASLRSGGNMLLFAKRTNIVAWSRFAFSGLIEVRGLYKESGLDVTALEKDVEKEWERLFKEG